MSKFLKGLGVVLAVAVTIIICYYGLQYFGWVQFFGWLYSGAFALSALPQSLRSIKEGHSNGVADGTLVLWFIGELAGLVYGFGLGQIPIIEDCLVNTVFVGIIVWYRLRPRS